MSVELDTKDMKMKHLMSKGEIEATIGKILLTHKNAVFLGFSQNYLDFEIHYMDWRDDTKKSFILREGKADLNHKKVVDPHWQYWKKEIHELFVPIMEYMVKETDKHERGKKGLI